MGLSNRIKRLESDAPGCLLGACQCESVVGESGLRMVYESDGVSEPSGDYEAMCTRCGLERITLRVIYGNDKNKGA